MDDKELKQALTNMLQAELDAMHYYQYASNFLTDKDAIYHFTLLAQEELEHARTFYAVYPDQELPEFDELVKTMPNRRATRNNIEPKLLGRLNERTALQLALKMEEEVADSLKRMLAEVTSPAARAVIEENIESTLSHYELIEEDYLRLFEQLADT